MSRFLCRRSAFVGFVLAAGLSVEVLAGCGSSTAAAPIPPPATVISIPGGASVRVRLTADAASRIGLQTATIQSQVVPGRPQLAAAPTTATATTAATTAATTPTTGPASTTATTARVLAPGDTEPARNGATTTTSPNATSTPPTAPPPVATTTTVPAPRLTVPAAAVLYQPSGQAFVYVVTGTLTYERQPIVVDYVVDNGGLAVLVSGPPPGTMVVTVGADEVLGAELGVGGQELGS